jgi:NAD(P)H-flavin reductase
MTLAQDPYAQPGTGAAAPAADESPVMLPRAELGRLIDALRATGRQVWGPVVRDGALAVGEIDDPSDLAAGVAVSLAPGRAKLTTTSGEQTFAHQAGPPWKAVLFPPRVDSLRASRDPDGTVAFGAVPVAVRPVALLGLRACDLAAIAIQDRVLADGPVRDTDYASRRAGAFLVTVQCTAAALTCFCGSTGTGPEAGPGSDLVLTEMDEGFIVRSGSPAGAELLDGLRLAAAPPDLVGRAGMAVEDVRRATAGQLPAGDLAGRLVANPEHPRWAAVAERCLSCTNCTLVCPTCFCTGATQRTDLDGRVSIVEREWQSCFGGDYARVAGWDVRSGTRERYRQWLTHKFGTWWEQFGSTGCVGCGRCIAWCPVGIDVREELIAIAGGPATDEALALPKPAFGPRPDRWLPVVEPAAWEGFIPADVVETQRETADTVTLKLSPRDPRLLETQPGQFVMASLPGFPAPPISVSRVDHGLLSLTIRAAGAATTALTDLVSGDQVGLRGPLGRPWPIDSAAGRDVVVVAGGIGLAPLRPVIDAIRRDRGRFADVRLVVGSRTPADRLFADELARLARETDLDVRQTVDRPDASWSGEVGLVIRLLAPDDRIGPDAVAFVCGPERMIPPVGTALSRLGIPRERVWVSLERTMQCGVGLCGHCQLGSLFVCRDGPVFSLAELGDRLEHEGL